jgi:hypothetical protein
MHSSKMALSIFIMWRCAHDPTVFERVL